MGENLIGVTLGMGLMWLLARVEIKLPDSRNLLNGNDGQLLLP